jgi:hypothetical protein
MSLILPRHLRPAYHCNIIACLLPLDLEDQAQLVRTARQTRAATAPLAALARMSPFGGTGWGGQLQSFPVDSSLWAMAAVPLLSTGVLGLVVGILVRLQPSVSAY